MRERKETEYENVNEQPVVQKEPLEHSNSRPDFGHSPDGHDLKQKEQQKSAGFADKTSSHIWHHSSASGDQKALREKRDVSSVVRRNGGGYSSPPQLLKCLSFFPILHTFLSC